MVAPPSTYSPRKSKPAVGSLEKSDTYIFAKQQQGQLTADFNHRILLVSNASQTMKNKYVKMNHDHTTLMDFRQIYKNNIVSNYEKIFIDPIKN